MLEYSALQAIFAPPVHEPGQEHTIEFARPRR